MIQNRKKLILINKLSLILNLTIIILFCIYIFKSFFLGYNHFTIKKVNIYVNNKLTRFYEDKFDEIIRENLTGNIILADLDKVKFMIEGIKWVNKVRIKRILWPSSIDIEITEERPIARWKDGSLIDIKGNTLNIVTDEIFPIFEADDNIVDIEFVKKDMAKMFNNINNILANNNIYIRKLKLSNIFSWDILLDNGVLIKLGRENNSKNILNKFKKFIKAWNASLKDEVDKLEYIDMRYDDGLSVFYKNIDLKAIKGVD